MGIETICRVLLSPPNVKRRCRAARVQDDQNNRAIRIAKGHRFQTPRTKCVRFNPHRSGREKFAGMRQRGEILVRHNLRWRNRMVYRNYAAARLAPSEEWLVIPVQY